MSAALTSRASIPPMWEALSRTIRKLSPGSSKSVLVFNKSSLARATGPVLSHASFCLVKVNGRLREVIGGTTQFLGPLYETQ